MRREYFDLEVEHVGWVGSEESPRTPTLVVDFDGPLEVLDERLAGPDGEPLAADATDVAYRLHTDPDDADATGVLSVTNRVTGDFVLELNASAAGVRRFVRAARAYGTEADDADGDRYRVVVVRVDGEEYLTHDKSIFLVYDRDGSLLRQQSLIPGGVEL